MEEYDVLVVGAGPGGSSAAKKCVDRGLKTLLIDRQKLPRRKACSGIIANVSQNYVFENFGPIPESAYGKPYVSKGMAFHFPSSGTVISDTDCYHPYVWRDKFDHFLATSSGAKLQDETSFVNLDVKDKNIDVTLRHKGKNRKVRVKYLVGADGGRSKVTLKHAPDVFKNQNRVWVCQKMFDATIDASPYHLYWFMAKGWGPFPFLEIKDDQVIIGFGQAVGTKFANLFSMYLDYLRKNFNLQIKKEIATEGCFVNVGTPMNRFFPGRGRVLMVGDALGFMGVGHCSISCALISGGNAGDAIANALEIGGDALGLYKEVVRPEIEVTLDQYNPFRFIRSTPSGAYRQAPFFNGFSYVQRLKMVSEMLGFIKKEGKLFEGMLPAIIKSTANRTLLGKYRVGIAD